MVFKNKEAKNVAANLSTPHTHTHTHQGNDEALILIFILTQIERQIDPDVMWALPSFLESHTLVVLFF